MPETRVTPSSLGEVLAPNPTVKKPIPKIDPCLHCSRKARELQRQSVAMGVEFSPGLPVPKVKAALYEKHVNSASPELSVLNKDHLLGAFTFDELRGNHFLLL